MCGPFNRRGRAFGGLDGFLYFFASLCIVETCIGRGGCSWVRRLISRVPKEPLAKAPTSDRGPPRKGGPSPSSSNPFVTFISSVSPHVLPFLKKS